MDIDDLIDDVVSAAKDVSAAYEWGSGSSLAEAELTRAKDALRAEVAVLRGVLDFVTADRDNRKETAARLAAEVASLRAALETLRLERDYRPRMDVYERVVEERDALRAALTEAQGQVARIREMVFEDPGQPLRNVRHVLEPPHA